MSAVGAGQVERDVREWVRCLEARLQLAQESGVQPRPAVRCVTVRRQRATLRQAALRGRGIALAQGHGEIARVRQAKAQASDLDRSRRRAI
jgi:hypothetical protein